MIQKQDKTVSRQRLLLIVLSIVVCIVTAGTHWPALSAQAVSLDDDVYLKSSPLLSNPSWSSARQIVREVFKPSTVGGAYSPVTMLSQMLDFAMGGCEANLRPFHRTSLIIHVCNTALVIVLIYQLFGNVWAAAMAGLVFGVHPLAVGRIAWMTDRKTVLSAFFGLWCLVFYVRFIKSRDRRIYCASLLMYVLSLLSKPTSLPIPAVMLLLDYWPLQRRLSWGLLREKAAFFAAGAVSFVISYISFANTVPIVKLGEPGAMRVPKILCHNIIFYLQKMFWPVNLSVFYPFPKPLSLSNPAVLAGVVGTFLLAATLLVSWRWTRAVITGWLIFFAAIFPAMGAIGFSSAIADDRFVYFPSIGILLLLGWVLCQFWGDKTVAYLAIRRVAIVSLVTIIAALEIMGSRAQIVHWRDSIGHQRYLQGLFPHSAKLNYNLGLALARENKDKEAAYYFSQALAAEPDFPKAELNLSKAYNNMGIMLAKRGEIDKAIEHFRKAIQIEPLNDRAHHNIAQAYHAKGNITESVKHYRESLRLNPDSAETMAGLSWILATSSEDKFRNAAEALGLSKRACELTSYKDAEMLNILAAAYAENSQFEDAVQTSQRAIDLCLSAGNKKRAADFTAALQLYQARRPYPATPPRP
jgi:tetratricopeptide (TPR) repeat protein